MTMFGSQWFAAPDTAYTIDQSIRFNDDDSAQLSKTYSGAGNRKTASISMWIKRANISAAMDVFGVNSSNLDTIRFNSNDTMMIRVGNADSTTDRVFRDVGAWGHLFIVRDTTQSTDTNRLKAWWNNEAIVFSSYSVPSQDTDTEFMNSVIHRIGTEGGGSSQFFDGYLAEIHVIDGTAKAATDFGETNSDTGQWVPKAYSGSYGTNGFYIDGRDSSDLGDDESGNGNDFASSNLAAADQMSDSPTNNFWTLNPLDSGSTISDGNLKNGGGSSTNTHAPALPTTGKWYWEVVCTDINTGTAGAHFFGICNAAVYQSEDFTAHATISAGQQRGGQLKKNNSNTSTGTAVNDGNTVGMAFDADNLTLKLYVDGSQSGSTITSLTAGAYKLWIQDGGTVTNMTLNFGQSDFDQTVPTGYSSLCTNNLPNPQVENSSAYFHTQLYTGNDTSGHSITNNAQAGDFQPDWIIFAPRSNGDHHNVIDAVRGSDRRMQTNNTTAEQTDDPALFTFESNGFDIDTTDVNYNGSGRTYVAWQWKANGSGSSNEDGSINTTATSANTTAGFSISTYTGNGTSGATFGHGLGAAPKFVIVKERDPGGDNWIVGLDAIGWTKYLALDSNSATTTSSARWNDTTPTSTVVTLGDDGSVNANTATYVAYCFAEVEGFSRFGTYEGNSNANGTFIYTGFRPAWITVKTMDSGNDWVIYDTKRDPINIADTILRMDSTNSEYSGSGREIDILSNGFKMRTSNGTINASATFAYMAFAEYPFKYANARE